MEERQDLISRQAAVDAIEKVAGLYPWKVPGNRDSYSQYNEAWQDALDRAEGAIGNLPSAQPEIIRCKDCRFNDGVAYCEMHYRDVKGNDFCSWAERRQDG